MRETLQVPTVKDTGSPRSSLEDKYVIIVDDGTDEAAITPIGGGAVQVGVEQIAIGSRCSLAQRSRDTASSGPLRLHHYRT
jgi:hypothetical protein